MAPQEKISMLSSEKILHADNVLSIFFSVRRKLPKSLAPIREFLGPSPKNPEFADKG